jgi:hypothetical protein
MTNRPVISESETVRGESVPHICTAAEDSHEAGLKILAFRGHMPRGMMQKGNTDGGEPHPHLH